jgi:hypothetical protein
MTDPGITASETPIFMLKQKGTYTTRAEAVDQNSEEKTLREPQVRDSHRLCTSCPVAQMLRRRGPRTGGNYLVFFSGLSRADVHLENDFIMSILIFREGGTRWESDRGSQKAKEEQPSCHTSRRTIFREINVDHANIFYRRVVTTLCCGWPTRQSSPAIPRA